MLEFIKQMPKCAKKPSGFIYLLDHLHSIKQLFAAKNCDCGFFVCIKFPMNDYILFDKMHHTITQTKIKMFWPKPLKNSLAIHLCGLYIVLANSCLIWPIPA